MTEFAQKRKQNPRGDSGARDEDSKKTKKSKLQREGGNVRWKTSHHKAKAANRAAMGTTLEVGDAGIWVTFARGMTNKAAREFKELCDEYGETLYGIKRPGADEDMNTQGADEEDIEACVQRELSEMKTARKTTPSRADFSIVKTGLECLMFIKTRAPVHPGELVLKMCEDARDCGDPRQRKVRYINRLTPVVDTDKATESGIDRVSRTVLAPHFTLADGSGKEAIGEASTYAVRYNIRKHNIFKSSQIINKIAGLIDSRHKVNLDKPDRVILVEVFQLFCGMSVVDGQQLEGLRRYNMHELYAQPTSQQPGLLT